MSLDYKSLHRRLGICELLLDGPLTEGYIMEYVFETKPGPDSRHCFIANSQISNSPIKIIINGTCLSGGFFHRLKLAWKLLFGRLGLVTDYRVVLANNVISCAPGQKEPAVEVVN